MDTASYWPPSCLRVRVLLSESGFSGVGHLDPLRIGRGVRDVAVGTVPPLVRPALRVTLRRVFPRRLSSGRSHVQGGPGGPRWLLAPVVDEVGAEPALTVAEECVVA